MNVELEAIRHAEAEAAWAASVKITPDNAARLRHIQEFKYVACLRNPLLASIRITALMTLVETLKASVSERTDILLAWFSPVSCVAQIINYLPCPDQGNVARSVVRKTVPSRPTVATTTTSPWPRSISTRKWEPGRQTDVVSVQRAHLYKGVVQVKSIKLSPSGIRESF